MPRLSGARFHAAWNDGMPPAGLIDQADAEETAGLKWCAPNRRSNKIITHGPKADGAYWVEFRTADGRVHRAMLESEAGVPRHCFGARHSRPRAAQVVSDSLTIHSNHFLVSKGAHVQAAGSAHPLSCLIEISSWTLTPTIGLDGTVVWCQGESRHAPWRAIDQCYTANTGLTFRTCAPRSALPLMLICSAANGCHCRASNNALLCST